MLSKYSQMYMHQAWQIASHSPCPDRKVGCIITLKDRPISNGYNGTEPGASNRCLDDEGQTLPNVIHAEANAISWLKSNNLPGGDTIYLTLAPCLACAKLIFESGIKTVVYYEVWPKSNAGLEYLMANKIRIHSWESITCLK